MNKSAMPHPRRTLGTNKEQQKHTPDTLIDIHLYRVTEATNIVRKRHDSHRHAQSQQMRLSDDTTQDTKPQALGKGRRVRLKVGM